MSNKYLNISNYFRYAEKKIFGWQRTYSQCGEDLILEHLIIKPKGFYVDIGSNDPRHLSNTYYFYKKGWRGINIEPNPRKRWLYRLFRTFDINLSIGIAEVEMESDFYSFKEDFLSTFSKEVADSYLAMGHKLRETIKVKISPLSKVLEQYLAVNQKIDYMTIDTEGYDLAVLKSNDWGKYRPSYVILESLEYQRDGSGKKLDSIYDGYMQSISYRKIADTYLNSIYVDELS